MGGFERERDEHALPMCEFTCQLATMEPPPPEVQQLFGPIWGSQRAMDGFVRMNDGRSHRRNPSHPRTSVRPWLPAGPGAAKRGKCLLGEIGGTTRSRNLVIGCPRCHVVTEAGRRAPASMTGHQESFRWDRARDRKGRTRKHSAKSTNQEIAPLWRKLARVITSSMELRLQILLRGKMANSFGNGAPAVTRTRDPRLRRQFPRFPRKR